jgi:hypothetical protein
MEEAIPNLYIFKEKRMRCNILELANSEDTMVMQPQVWMISFFFDSQVLHFVMVLEK